MIKQYLIATAIGAAVAIIIVIVFVFIAAPAHAHTPTVQADCSGVTVTGNNYDPDEINTLTIHVDGTASDTEQFETSGTLTVKVPQDGEPHGWTASVTSTDPNYNNTYSGTVGPCGEKPEPKPEPPASSVTPPIEQPVPTTHTSKPKHGGPTEQDRPGGHTPPVTPQVPQVPQALPDTGK